jgi:hypothetical protein
MEVVAVSSAVYAVKSLNEASSWLHDAVLASKRNDMVMSDIASTVCIRAPAIKRLLLEIVHSDDADVDRAFCHAIRLVVQEMDKARLVVYGWLVKGPIARLTGASEMEKALKDVRHVLDRSLVHVMALQVDDTQQRVKSFQSGAQQLQQKVGVYSAQVEAVATQLGRLLEGGSSDTARTMEMARFALKLSAKGYVKFKGHTGYVMCVAWSADGSRLVTASGDGTAALWDAVTGRRVHVLKGHADGVSCVAWSADGSQLATASTDGTAALWDAGTGRRLLSLRGHTGEVWCVAWSPDGSQLATASEDKTAALWDARTGLRLLSLNGHTGPVMCVAWSPDGSQLATGSGDKTAALWDAATGQRRRALKGHVGYVKCVAWSPDGSQLATASWDKTVGIWDAGTGRRLQSLEGHSGPVKCVAWSPDGSQLATAPWDRTAALWDSKTGQQLQALEGRTGTKEFYCVAWSPDGSQLATASGDNTAALWKVSRAGSSAARD